MPWDLQTVGANLSLEEEYHKIMSFLVCVDILRGATSKNSSVVCTFVSTIGSSHPNANAMYHECTTSTRHARKCNKNNKDKLPFSLQG
jgi:hypothetical protein